MEKENQVKALPVWDGNLAPSGQHFQTGMQWHGPFIVTATQARNDLGQCIISTRAPHLVCKIHRFRTCCPADKNERQQQVAAREEQARREWLEQRSTAFENHREAARKGVTVKMLLEEQGRVYDEEFDEPRIVVKVPGLNAYLELLGTLDDTPTGKEVDWTGEHGVLNTLDSMAEWAQNIWDRRDRRQLASQPSDLQPLVGWSEGYNPELRPWMPRKRGLGFTFADPSRRPDMLYSKAPQGSADYGMIRELKRAQAAAAADGVAPENYGDR